MVQVIEYLRVKRAKWPVPLKDGVKNPDASVAAEQPAEQEPGNNVPASAPAEPQQEEEEEEDRPSPRRQSIGNRKEAAKSGLEEAEAKLKVAQAAYDEAQSVADSGSIMSSSSAQEHEVDPMRPHYLWFNISREESEGSHLLLYI